MELVKLAVIFLIIILAMNLKPTIRGKKRKVSLSASILVGCLMTMLLYGISPWRVCELAVETITSWETLSLCLVTYLITFLQRMMEQKQRLRQAQRALSALFNSRRVNATVAPALIGLLPSPAAAFLVGDIVKEACGDYLDQEEMAFVTSYFRHISESCLPTYSSIILALSLAGVDTGLFLIGMIVPVIVLILLGYLMYVRRKIPTDTGLPKSDRPGRECLSLLQSLWPIALIVILIIAFQVSVWLAVAVVVVLYFFVDRLKAKEVAPFVVSAFEWNIMSNTVVVMFFKNIIAESGVITLLPDAFGKLPLPSSMVFALIFLVGTIIAGSNAIIAMCIPMAFAAIPGAGVPLMVLLMCSSYIAMQVSPTHICLTLIAEYFHVSLGAMIQKTIPILICFVIVLIPYYYLLLMIPGL